MERDTWVSCAHIVGVDDEADFSQESFTQIQSGHLIQAYYTKQWIC